MNTKIFYIHFCKPAVNAVTDTVVYKRFFFCSSYCTNSKLARYRHGWDHLCKVENPLNKEVGNLPPCIPCTWPCGPTAREMYREHVNSSWQEARARASQTLLDEVLGAAACIISFLLFSWGHSSSILCTSCTSERTPKKYKYSQYKSLPFDKIVTETIEPNRTICRRNGTCLEIRYL